MCANNAHPTIVRASTDELLAPTFFCDRSLPCPSRTTYLPIRRAVPPLLMLPRHSLPLIQLVHLLRFAIAPCHARRRVAPATTYLFPELFHYRLY
jgi:hypothetical protein